MKKTIYFFASTIFVAGTIFTGCKPSAEKIEKAEENVAEAKQDLQQAEMDYTAAIQEFKDETNARITANEKNIAELNAKTENEKKETRAERKKRIAELEQKNSNMKKRMDEYQHNDKDGWESFKREFNHDMDELGNALNDLTVNNKK